MALEAKARGLKVIFNTRDDRLVKLIRTPQRESVPPVVRSPHLQILRAVLCLHPVNFGFRYSRRLQLNVVGSEMKSDVLVVVVYCRVTFIRMLRPAGRGRGA